MILHSEKIHKIFMTDKTLGQIIAVVIALLLIFQIGALIAGLLGVAWGIASAVVVAGVSYCSARLAKAGGKSSAWFLLPTFLFTLLPFVAVIWKTVVKETTWFDRTITLMPFIIGFATPVLLLLVVFYELRKRTRGNSLILKSDDVQRKS
jgi:hypothetical protein